MAEVGRVRLGAELPGCLQQHFIWPAVSRWVRRRGPFANPAPFSPRGVSSDQFALDPPSRIAPSSVMVMLIERAERGLASASLAAM